MATTSELHRRLLRLEAHADSHKGPCFWCHCEGAAGLGCEHRGWLPLRHEDALQHLTRGETNARAA